MHATPDRLSESRTRLIPIAADGSVFDASCAHADGTYRVGRKGDEVAVAEYADALELLRTMPVASWRRPSAGSGRLGIVRAVGWIDPNRR